MTLDPISQGSAVEGFGVILVDDINSLKYHGARSAARTKDIIMCVEEFSLMVIICDMRLLSCSIRALSVISDGSWSHFSPLIISQAVAMMKKSVYGLCTFKYVLSFTLRLCVACLRLCPNSNRLCPTQNR